MRSRHTPFLKDLFGLAKQYSSFFTRPDKSGGHARIEGMVRQGSPQVVRRGSPEAHNALLDQPWHAMPPETVIEEFETHVHGLTRQEAALGL